MNWNNSKWSNIEIKKYRIFCKTIKGTEKDCRWEQKIINTKLECFGKTISKARKFALNIKNGNFLDFIDNVKVNNFFDCALIGHLLNYIKNFEDFKPRLIKYINKVDNWAGCDIIKFKKFNHQDLFQFSNQLIKSKKEFVRREAINIYFELINEPKFLLDVFRIILSLKNEEHYYVNMVAAWLLCECFIKYKKQTLNFLINKKINNFILKQTIQKCRDSFRISQSDKKLLVKLNKKYPVN